MRVSCRSSPLCLFLFAHPPTLGRRVCSTLFGPSGLAFLPVHWTRFGLRVRQESLFSARALQSNEAALWLYARVRAPPTSAAEGCEDREIWKGSWTSAGPRLRWSLVRSFSVVMCARREREAAPMQSVCLRYKAN